MAAADTKAADKAATPAGDKPKRKGGRPKGVPVVPSTVAIDYKNVASAEDLQRVQAVRKSAWTTQLQTLKDDTFAGKVPMKDGAPMYVLIGRFTTPAGAQSIVRNFEKNPERLPKGGTWDFSKKIVVVNGKTGSELYARFLIGPDTPVPAAS